MRRDLMAGLAAFAFMLVPLAASAQTAPGGAPATTKPAPSSPSRAARPAREPTAGQMAARERQKKCGAEWRDAKAGGKTGGLKWPQYWSQCNARLKGSHV